MKANDYSKWQRLLLFTALLFFINGCMTTGQTPLDDTESPPDDQKTVQNTITSVSISGNQVVIQSDNKLTYTSVKHIVPNPGIVFYFPDTILKQVKDINDTGNKIVKAIMVRQQDLNGPYSKLELVLSQDTTYNTTQNGNQLLIEFDSTDYVEESSETIQKLDTLTLEPSQPVTVVTEQPKQSDTNLSKQLETEQPKQETSSFSIETTPFSRNALIQIHAINPIDDYKSSVITDPPKIVFDLFDIQSPDRNMTFSVDDNPFVKAVRTFRYPKRLRVVIDTVPDYVSSFQAYPSDEGLSVYVGLDLPAKEAKEMLDIPATPILKQAPVMTTPPQNELITSGFQEKSPVIEPPSTIQNVDTTPDKQLSTDESIDSSDSSVQATAAPAPDFQSVFQSPVPQPAPPKMAPAQPDQTVTSQSVVSAPKTPDMLTKHLTQQYHDLSFIQPSTMMDSYVQKGNKQKYTGEKIAIDFYEIDIKNVFRILREVSGQNFAIDSDVSGKVTLTLKKPVPWDQILDLVLKMNKLGITYENDIIRISKMSTIQKAQEERIAKIEAEFKAAKKREELLEPVLTHYIPVNYARATDLTKHLEKITSKERGSISVDDRTNMIIITDVKERIQHALSVVYNLDKPNLQVMIETRIIEVTNNFSRDIGVNWSGTIGVQPGDAAAGVGPQRGYDVLGGTYGYNWAVNYPAAANSNIGINFRRLSGLTPFTLDAQLSAMESKGEIRILTSPRIVALDNKEATIEQGLEYPINTLDEKGNTITEFKDVDLDLKVTPHITQDGRVSMLIDTSKNDLGPVVNGKQSFQKKQAKTELLVNDGDTVVIGGIMKTVRNTSRSGVPLLSRLPIIGWLFSTHSKSDDKEELIIFITPKIIKMENKSLVKKMTD
jgi:type IV pilus assembly protein PilQ